MWCGKSGVAFLSFEKGFGGEKFRGLADALRSHSAPRGRILRNRVRIHLTATSCGRFTPLFFIALIYAKGPFKDHKRSPSASWSISDGP